MNNCNCAIALRVSSTLACKAIRELYRIAPDTARRLIGEANEHARRLRTACEAGEHGPQEKRKERAGCNA